MGYAAEQLEYETVEAVNDDTTIEAASERLASAFDRLEDIIASRLTTREPASHGHFSEEQETLLGLWQEQCALLEQENEHLKMEYDRVSGELSQTKREFEDLREITNVVAGRLEGTIGTIDKLLDA